MKATGAAPKDVQRVVNATEIVYANAIDYNSDLELNYFLA